MTAAGGEKLACWAEGFNIADLDFDNSKESFHGLAFCIVAGWFFSTAYCLEGRQTVEIGSFTGPAQLSVTCRIASNGKLGGAWERGYCREPSRSHGYKFTYRHTHTMLSNLLDNFFMVFYFVKADLSTEITEICIQLKFPTIRYMLVLACWVLTLHFTSCLCQFEHCEINSKNLTLD